MDQHNQISSQDFLQNHDLSGEIKNKEQEKPIETLQNRDADEDDEEDEDSSSQGFASPIPISNTVLSQPAEVTSIIIKEVVAVPSLSPEMKLDQLSPREDGIPLEVIHDSPTPFNMDISPIKEKSSSTENANEEGDDVQAAVEQVLGDAVGQATPDPEGRINAESASRLSTNQIRQQLSPQERRRQYLGQSDEPAPVFTIVNNTTRSPRVFPMKTNVSTFDEIINRKLPRLRELITPDEDADLYHMVTALERKKSIFEQAFIAVKQETEEEMKNIDEPNPKTVSFMERIDMIYVRYMDKIVDYLTRVLPMDLEPFYNFFQWSFSLKKTAFTITLAQFVQIYIEYIETTHKSRTADLSIANKPDNSMLNDVVDDEQVVDQNRYLFSADTFCEQQDMISDKLQLHDHKIRKFFSQKNPENPLEISLGKVRELWCDIGQIIHAVLVKAGSEFVKGQQARLVDDPECVDQLSEHICLAWYILQRGTGRLDPYRLAELKSIIRATQEGQEGTNDDGDDWPREFVKNAIKQRDEIVAAEEDEAIIRPRVIQFADEAAFKPNSNIFDNKCISVDFFLRQIEEFLQTRRSVVLVDLDRIFPRPPSTTEEIKKTEPPLPKPIIQLEPKKPKKKAYEEDDPTYVPPPSEISPEAQSIIDANLIEVFNIYCRKFASLKGDFSQLNQNLYVLGLQGYTKFCKDFKVPLANNDITLVWKKSSNNHFPHEFEQFQKSISLLGTMLNKTRVEKFQARQKLLRQEQKRRRKSMAPVPKQQQLAAKTTPISTKSALEQKTEGEISGELAQLYQQIGRTTLLSEAQSRIQMYSLLEIQYPDQYRHKLPYTDLKELNDNILMSKRLLNPIGEQTSSNYGAISSKLSQIQIGGGRLASNPAVKERAPRAILVRNNQAGAAAAAAFKRKSTLQRPSVLFSPKTSVSGGSVAGGVVNQRQLLVGKRSAGDLHDSKEKGEKHKAAKQAELFNFGGSHSNSKHKQRQQQVAGRATASKEEGEEEDEGQQLMTEEPVIVTSPLLQDKKTSSEAAGTNGGGSSAIQAQVFKRKTSTQVHRKEPFVDVDHEQLVLIQNHEEQDRVVQQEEHVMTVKPPNVNLASEELKIWDWHVIDHSDSREVEQRQKLAEIYKKIRTEKQNTGTILTFTQAKQILDTEKTPQPPVPKQPEVVKPVRKISQDAKNERLKQNKPIQQLNRVPTMSRIINKNSRTRQNNNMALSKATPSVVDLKPQKILAPTRNNHTRKRSEVPTPSLTFDDLQKMHYSNLNNAGKGSAVAVDDFRPEDFLDLQSGSDNDQHDEVLARFKKQPIVPRKRSSSNNQTNNFSSYQLTQQKQGGNDNQTTEVDHEYFVQEAPHPAFKNQRQQQPATEKQAQSRKNHEVFQSYRQYSGHDASGTLNHQGEHNNSQVKKVSRSNQPTNLQTKEDQMTTLGALSIFNDVKSPSRSPHMILPSFDEKSNRIGQQGLLVNSKSNVKVGSTRISISNLEPFNKGNGSGKRSLTKPSVSALHPGSRIPSVMIRQLRQGSSSNLTESQLIEASGLPTDTSQTPQHKHKAGGSSKIAQIRRSHNQQYAAVLHTDDGVQSEASHRQQFNSGTVVVGNAARAGAGTSKSSAAISVSDSIQQALLRAQSVQDRANQDQQRRMDDLMSLQEKNLQKGLSTANRK